MKKLALLFFTAVLFLSSFSFSFAQEASPSASPESKPVDSFELFWPMVAGKTSKDSLYSLKLFKERLKGFVTFTASRKVDYKVFLATKRSLEAEKLLNDDNSELAMKAFNMASDELSTAQELWEEVDSASPSVSETKTSIAQKLVKLETFYVYLDSKTTDKTQEKVKTILDKIHNLQFSLGM